MTRAELEHLVGVGIAITQQHTFADMRGYKVGPNTASMAKAAVEEFMEEGERHADALRRIADAPRGAFAAELRAIAAEQVGFDLAVLHEHSWRVEGDNNYEQMRNVCEDCGVTEDV